MELNACFGEVKDLRIYLMRKAMKIGLKEV